MCHVWFHASPTEAGPEGNVWAEGQNMSMLLVTGIEGGSGLAPPPKHQRHVCGVVSRDSTMV